MAWKVASGTNLRMSEGDWGIGLSVTVDGVTLGASDALLYTFKDSLNGKTILTKTFDNITDNTISLSFTQAESALFSPGVYPYSLDWYQNGSFLCNLIEVGTLTVGDKA